MDVNLKLPSKPTNKCIDHVEQSDDDGQEDWNVDCSGRQHRQMKEQGQWTRKERQRRRRRLGQGRIHIEVLRV